MSNPSRLTEEERQRYEWQLWIPGWGEEGQRRLKAATVLISRIGGVGGQVAYQLAAAGVGRLVLAHGGVVRLPDLNRQLLMTHDWLGKPRVECAARRLRELNPQVEIIAVPENVREHNAAALVGQADVVVDAAPLFEERFLMNREAVRQRKPMIECAMYDMTAQITTILPGQTACLACLCPEKPPDWKRQFPVVGAVSGVAGCLAAVEVFKVITGVAEPLKNELLLCDLRTMTFKKVRTRRSPQCPVCGTLA